MRFGTRAGIVAALAMAGCGVLPDVQITGKVNVTGDAPSALKFEVYSALTNPDAFDTSYCDGADTDGDCYGRVIMSKLTKPVKTDPAEVDGDKYTVPGVPADVGYIMVIGSDDPNVLCNSVVVGVDAGTKVVTSESAIAIDATSPTDFDVPGVAELSCATLSTEPEVPVEDPPSPPPADEDIPAPAVPAWDSFTITGKGGAPVYGDASGGSVPADVVCDASFPSVMEVHGQVQNSDRAFIRIQFGSGDTAEYRTIETPVNGGVVDQEITLTGGYAVVQLDTDEELNGTGESNTITFCERDDRPVQEFMLILSWDADDTDVDSHVFARGEEVAYYNLHSSWGMLDIDDIDGFGPETLTSNPDVEGEAYDVRIHYYSDHGNGPTTATARVVYADPTGAVCDVTVTKTLSSYEWWDVGTFAPGLCPE